MASDIEFPKELLPWKEQPCHFTWSLSAGDLTDYGRIIRHIENDLKMSPDLLRVDQLLFRSYLEVSDRRFSSNVGTARKFLDEADDYIQNQTKPELQHGYRRVALLNRIWIEHKSHNTKKVDKLLSELHGLRMDEADKVVVKTLLASALTRLGPTKFTRSLQIYEEALKHFPNNVGFLFGALLMSGRKMRFDRTVGSMYEDLDEDGQELMNKEQKYCKDLIKVNDEYQYGKSYLGLNLSRRRDRRDEARKLLEEAHEKAPDVESVFNNLMRFYRREGDLDKAIKEYCSVFSQPTSNLDVPESHNQLALCYIAAAKASKCTQQKEQWQEEALKHLDECLRIEPMHFVAAMKKVKLKTDQKEDDDEKRLCFEDILQKSEQYSKVNKLTILFECANTGSSFNLDMWRKVMDILSSFEYLNETSFKWELRGNRAKDAREAAFGKLTNYYKGRENENLHLGILHFQNLDFEKAIQKLEELDPKTNLDSPCYLAEAYLKWGREKELSKKPTEAVRDCYEKARRNISDARKQGLNSIRCRKLLSDTALAISHFNLETNKPQQSPSQILIESDCMESYREAVRCGSLVASLEVLRLIERDFIKKTPRSKFLQVLAEIDTCCSQRPSDCLHRDVKPRSFVNGLNSRDTDIDTFALDCMKIKRVILTTLHQDTFFRQAWAQHFAMEKKVLEERSRNNEGELELDGREESSIQNDSTEEMYSAIDCCEKLRPLLDHIIVKFEKCELGSQEERRKRYFPLVFGEKDSVRIEEVLQEKLQSYFEINFKGHYPKLYKKLVQVQPGYNPQNGFLETFYTVVNHVKHSGIQTQEISKMVQDPVKLARQCTDKVEEICNYFFDAMKESSDLREKVEELVTDLQQCSGRASSRREMDEAYEKAAELLRILTDHEDFIVRMDSTWKLLEMLAIVRQSKMHSYHRILLEEAENKLAEGTWDPSKNLRKSNLELEVSLLQTGDPSANEVLEKCRDTCKEADILLNEVMKKKKLGQHDDAEVEFPFRDMHPGSDTSSWKGKVKKHIKKSLTEKGINPSDELLKVILQAQPCSNEENYNFLLKREFLKECEGASVVPSSVSIQTDNGEEKSLNAVDLTRWCTNNAEKIASQALQGT